MAGRISLPFYRKVMVLGLCEIVYARMGKWSPIFWANDVMLQLVPRIEHARFLKCA